jgi:hypothetical protein
MSLPAGCGVRTLPFGHEQLNIKVRAENKARPLLRREQDLPTDSKDAVGHETSPTSRERQKESLHLAKGTNSTSEWQLVSPPAGITTEKTTTGRIR